jgi:hypothetical protein
MSKRAQLGCSGLSAASLNRQRQQQLMRSSMTLDAGLVYEGKSISEPKRSEITMCTKAEGRACEKDTATP